jgi:hypothetical protein
VLSARHPGGYFWLRVFTPWQGTVYVDNIRFE